MKEFLRKVGWLMRRSAKEAELREELRVHLELDAEERREEGMTEAEAGRAARRALGNVGLVQEDTRAAWGWRRLEQLARDADYGLRLVRRNPAFSGIAIATLALGIGGITAMFGAFDAVLIRPLPYADAGRLVMVWDEMGKLDVRAKQQPAPAEFLEWRRLNTVFTDIAGSEPADVSISGDGNPEQVPARKVTGNLWSVLGVQPARGRVFTETEDIDGAKVVVISDGLWQRRFGGSADVLGRTMMLNDEPYEIVGVMPARFYFMPSREIDIWMPASFPEWLQRSFGWHDAQIVARLKRGVTVPQAQLAMAALSRQVTAKDHPPHSAMVVPLREEIAGKTETALTVLLGASAMLLLIACANLANLLLSRSSARGREVALRTALGAGRGRLIAQFLTESLVLAGLGTIGGLALALPVMRFLETLVPEAMGATHLTADWRVLAFSAGIAVSAALTFGLVPALRGSQLSPLGALRDGGRGTAGAHSYWFRHALIITETALAVVLLTGGGVLLQTFQHLRQTDLGFSSEHLLTFETPLFRYKDFDRRVAFVNAEVEAMRAIPGVIGAGSIDMLPFTNFANATFYRLETQANGASVAGQVALIRNVSRDYLAVVGARLREGRFFDVTDRKSDEPVAIVNEAFANRNYPGRSPLGQRFKFGSLGAKGYWYRIVGVLKAIPETGMLDEVKPAVYRVREQCDQMDNLAAGVVVRTSVDPASIVPAVRAAIWSVDKNQPVARIQTMAEMVGRQLAAPSQSTTLLGAFALLALVLASLGIYGVLSYAVTERTSEIGVRMALGATSGQVLRSFAGRGLTLTLAGLGVGLVLAAIAARSMTALLYGFRPDYGPTIAGVSVMLVAVAALACFVPAFRASRVDPSVALRSE
jgi:putative ABC transport system permease protein